ncbi:hypothetical protein Mal15_32000 [Stieleria maiorica]|uniref:Carboxypeptidase regulatory-like domain-containing protein n=1 Tax=Stieleria maiorica TaxID=2795974 RepID=A0A5B9MGJ1_9BACT|nr:hypothetical protein [Stieleria maiorica]QEF99140.1 hypothetical protein Mal15_32000 [Stieleria maiorica]
MQSHIVQRATAFGLTLLTVLVGCSSPTRPSVSASGTVVVDGEPLSGAVITLEPMRGTTGPNASVPVFDGAFEIPASAALHGGTYRVHVAMIPAEILAGLPDPQSKSLPPAGAVIDPAFDADSNLTCQLIPDQTNTLTFAVKFLKR